MNERAKSGTFRFSLRSLFVLLTVVACWLGYQLRWAHQRQNYLSTLREEFRARGVDVELIVPGERTRAPGATWLFGEQGIETMAVLYDKGELEREVARVRSLFPETKVVAGLQRRKGAGATSPASEKVPAKVTDSAEPSAAGVHHVGPEERAGQEHDRPFSP